MKFLFLFLLLSCGQTYNSNTFDKSRFVESQIDISTPSGQRLKAAYDVLALRCMSCHTHSGWSQFTTSDQWVQNSLIYVGDASNSPIVSRLNNNGGDMPIGGYVLTDDEIRALENWINQL